MSLSLDGVARSDVEKVHLLYRQKMDELMAGGASVQKLFYECRRQAVESFSQPSGGIESILKEVASRRVYDGRLITDRELITLYSQIELDRALAFLSYIHPQQAYHRWGLPMGWEAPAGLPLEEILLT